MTVGLEGLQRQAGAISCKAFQAMVIFFLKILEANDTLSAWE